MAGDKINNYTQIDTNILELQLTQDANFIGKHNLSLTNYTSTAVPQIAAGSYLEVSGTLYEFLTDETITGSPSDGATYIYVIPATGTCTAEYTNTGPTWSDSKQGYYGTGASANYRYLEFYMVKSGSSYTKYNYRFARDNMYFPSSITTPTGSITTLTATTANITTANITDGLVASKAQFNGFLHGSTTLSAVYNAISSYLPVVGDSMKLNGMISLAVTSTVRRTSATTIDLYSLISTSLTPNQQSISASTGINVYVSISW